MRTFLEAASFQEDVDIKLPRHDSSCRGIFAFWVD